MRLCLDEHYSPEISSHLRELGHDVSAVLERQELRGLPDGELARTMQSERCVLLTENVADFAPIANRLAASGEDHWGFIFTSRNSMPRGSGTIGMYVEALHALLSEKLEEDALKNQVWWLQPLTEH